MRYITLFLFLLIAQSVYGQSKSELFKVIPNQNTEMPDWARLMYSDNPNVWEVDYLMELYYETHQFEKSIHTQNYKFWRKQIADYCQIDGTINIPPRKQRKEITRAIRDQREKTSKSTDVWTSIGPFATYRNNSLNLQSQHANVYSINVSTIDSDHILIGTESGGVFNSYNNGDDWNLITKEEDFAGGITSVQIDPSNDSRYLIYADHAIYESTNQGASWTELYVVGARVDEIKFDPQQSDIVYLTAQNGLHRSDDGGVTWSILYTEPCWDIDFHPTESETVYLLKSNNTLIRSEFFKSDDNGLTFTLQSAGWYLPQVPSEANNEGGKIAVSADDPDRVYTCLIGNSKAGDNGWIGLYRSDDSGESWSLPSGQIGGPYADMNTMPWSAASYGSGYHQGFYNFDCEASPDDADLVWFGTVRLNESTDGGSSYLSIGGANSTRLDYIHADIQAIEIQDGKIWIASDGGLNYSDDDLLSHVAKHRGMIASNFWGFGSGWNEDVYVGGKYHNGNTTYLGAYGLGETHNVGGVEEATGYVNPLLNNNVYFNQYWSGYTVRKILADDLGGNTANGSPVNIIPNESYVSSSSSGLYFHPKYAHQMYAGVDNTIQKSDDGGVTWSALHTFGTDGKVYEIEIARSNPDIIYCVYQPGGGYWDWCEIHKSTDGGQTFQMITNIDANRWRLEFSIDPYHPEEIWVSAINGSNGEKVYRSTDSGDTWTNVTTNQLDGQSISDILYQPGSEGIAYIVTTNGMYYFDPESNDWIDYSSGLPFQVKPLKLKPFYAQNKLRIATYGRGIWEAEIPISYTEKVEIITNTQTVNCSRDTVSLDSYSFVDQTDNAWLWTIEPSPEYIDDATARNPKVVLGPDGSYSVTLASTSNGITLSTTESDFITVDSQCEPDTIPGQSLQMVQAGDYVQLPDYEIEATQTFTISAWVKPNGIQDEYSGIVMGDNATGGLNFREANNTLAYHWPGGAWWYDSNLTVPADEWSHVAMVVTPTSVTLYVNGVGATHTTSPEAIDINSLKIGSYKGWSSRNYRGEIDEVAIWNRSLSQTEIREHRHLTKEDIVATDPDFIAYYQFNDDNLQILDRIGTKHGTLSGTSSLVTSTGPFGGGTSDMHLINSSGLYTYVNGNVELELGATGTYPNDEVYVSLINQLPFDNPENIEGIMSFFIVNNYGVDDFSSEVSITYDDPLTSPLPSSIESPQTLYLLTRSVNSDVETWDQTCSNTAVIGEKYHVQACNLQSGLNHQYILYKLCKEESFEMLPYLSGEIEAILVNEQIEANNMIFSGADILYKAGNEILLSNGFNTEAGAELLIQIGRCDN